MGLWRACALLAAAMLAACGAGGSPTPSSMPSTTTPSTTTPLATYTSSATYTPSPTSTPSATPSATPSVTPSATYTPTPTPWPTPDAEAEARAARLPILMYHYVEPWPEGAGELRKNLTVRPEDFAAQMRYLHDGGYETVSLYDLIYALTLGWPLPPRAVVLTFDDGYRSLMEYVAPVMETYGYRGTVFVVTEFMDREFEQYLTWRQAKQLYAQGWKIEPHTKTHPELRGRDRDFQLYQMLGSMQTVEAHIGTPPRFINYPAGKYDDLTLQLARELHLWGGVSVSYGRTHTLSSIYTLARVRISGQGSFQEFISAVEGDWQP